MVMLRRCNEWEPVSGRSWLPKRPIKLSFFIQDGGFKSFEIIQYNCQQKIKNELVWVSESASLLALNFDFKIWFGAC